MTGHDADNFVRVQIINDAAAIEQAVSGVVAALERHHYPKASLFAVKLCLHEALSNAFRHGHRGLPPSTPVALAYLASPDHVEIFIEDRGPGFDPASVPDPTLDENLERGSGRGLLLINAYMAVAEYSPAGNALHMVYRRPDLTTNT
ncbi:MAG: hypothetical protein HBSAPP03_17030 [Phycisphaerae bacterium]|nr:MAG: hypothetical protein HBSAPP03_17030 [Phycisphaerae bacterium]